MKTNKAPADPVSEGITKNDINAKEGKLDLSSRLYAQMIERSLVSMGNTARLARALKKAEDGEDITISFIGGSITQGAGAEPAVSECYAYKTFKGIKELLNGKDNIRLCKAGIGGTPSEFGVFRFERDVLRMGDPDIMIIEFAVNDDIDETKGEAYESLIRRVLSLRSEPAVILLFAVFIDDFNLQDSYSLIGDHYALPMVSVKDAVSPQFDDPENSFITRQRFFFDDYHPTNDGHTVMADCLLNLIKKVKEGKTGTEKAITDPGKKPLLGNDLETGFMIDKKDGLDKAVIDAGGFRATDADLQMTEFDDSSLLLPVMPYNYMYDGRGNYADFIIRLKCRVLVVMYKDTPDESFTQAEVYADDLFLRRLDPRENDWTHCNTKLLIHEKESREHTVRISIPKDKRNMKFTILGFGAVK